MERYWNPNVVFLLQKKYTHEPFESKCFLSFYFLWCFRHIVINFDNQCFVHAFDTWVQVVSDVRMLQFGLWLELIHDKVW